MVTALGAAHRCSNAQILQLVLRHLTQDFPVNCMAVKHVPVVLQGLTKAIDPLAHFRYCAA